VTKEVVFAISEDGGFLKKPKALGIEEIT